MIETRKPNLLRRFVNRLGETYGLTSRAAWLGDNGWEHHNDLLEGAGTAAARRAFRSNADVGATYGAVFAAIRIRTRMASKPRIVLVRRQGSDFVEEPDDHPALYPLHQMNESLTEKQGRSLIEQLLCTWGKAYLLKRRNGLRMPVEFEFWDPSRVEVVPDKTKYWVPAAFKRHLENGAVETVAPRDVVWLRHMIDPRDPMNGLSPIGAVRVQIDTGYEALRYNQRFFDSNTHPDRLYTVEEGGPGEVARIEQELERNFKGTDNAHKAMVSEGNLKVVDQPMPHKDMQFLEQAKWTRAEVASVFELSPLSIGALEGSTFSNVEWSDRKDWEAAIDQLENVMCQFEEFYVWPDFGREYELRIDASMVGALSENKKLQAEVDEINLRSGKVYINELRERDGEEVVAWGDVPILPNTMGPLDTRTGAEKDAAKPQPIQMAPNQPPPEEKPRGRSLSPEAMTQGWEQRLGKELRAVIRHLEAANRRALRLEDINSYPWDEWLKKYGVDVTIELIEIYEAALIAGDFIDTPVTPTHQLAVRQAERRAGELLLLDGRSSLVNYTRERVALNVAQAIEEGWSIRKLKNALRTDVGFSAGRAEMIARTETATAIGRANIMAYQSNGFEGKRWLVSATACPICEDNGSEGAIPVRDTFSSGDDAPPAHPNCTCSLSPVPEITR